MSIHSAAFYEGTQARVSVHATVRVEAPCLTGNAAGPEYTVTVRTLYQY